MTTLNATVIENAYENMVKRITVLTKMPKEKLLSDIERETKRMIAFIGSADGIESVTQTDTSTIIMFSNDEAFKAFESVENDGGNERMTFIKEGLQITIEYNEMFAPDEIVAAEAFFGCTGARLGGTLLLAVFEVMGVQNTTW